MKNTTTTTTANTLPTITLPTSSLASLITDYLELCGDGGLELSRAETMENLIEMIGEDAIMRVGLRETMTEYLGADDRDDREDDEEW